MDNLLSIQNATFKQGGQTIFQNLNFTLKADEHWGIAGVSGAGKTMFLKALAGELVNTSGHFTKNYSPTLNEEGLHLTDIRLLEASYTFKNLSGINDFFYQQRFNSQFSEDAKKVEEYLTDLEQKENPTGKWDFRSVVDLFQLSELLEKEIIKLSDGETKRLRLASLLIQNPRILLLDDPYVGLDIATRARFNDILSAIAQSGISLILTVRPDEIPFIVTDIAIFKDLNIESRSHHSPALRLSLDHPDPSLDEDALRGWMEDIAYPKFNALVKMQNVSVSYNGYQLLDQVTWHINQGERWALIGHNGAGKSTLLSLINTDNPQSYSNDITLFDRRRGTGESIWDVQKNIGFVSPELFHYYQTHQSCEEVIAGGLQVGPLKIRPNGLTPAEVSQKWINFFGLKDQAKKRFRTLTPSNQRLTLLARALIKNPCLLILDEPCQGLDDQQQKIVRSIIDILAEQKDLSIIYVTHYEDELPACIEHKLVLDRGKRVKV